MKIVCVIQALRKSLKFLEYLYTSVRLNQFHFVATENQAKIRFVGWNGGTNYATGCFVAFLGDFLYWNEAKIRRNYSVV